MEAKLNVKKVTQAMFEKCFKFADADKDDPFYMAVKPTANEKKVYAKYLASKATGRSRKTTRTRRKTKLCILLHFCVFLRFSAQPRRTSLWCDVMGCVRSGHFSALDAHACAFLRIRCASSRNAPQLHSMQPSQNANHGANTLARQAALICAF